MTEPDNAQLWARLAAIHPVLGPAYRAGAAASEARIKALKEALSDLLSLCENAAAGAFRNGVTDNSNTVDEGEVIAWRFMDNARALLKEETTR
jgi:hypothetical protein